MVKRRLVWLVFGGLLVVAFAPAAPLGAQLSPVTYRSTEVSGQRAIFAREPCDLPARNYFAGFGYYARPPANWAETPMGVYGDLQARPINRCSQGDQSGNNFSTNWVMLFNNAAAGGLAQARFMERGEQNCTHPFMAWTRDGTWTDSRWVVWGDCLTGGTIHPFQAQFNRANRRLDLYWAFTLMGRTSFDPWAAWTSFTPAYSAETTYTQSDVPGIVTSNARFQNLHIQSANGWGGPPPDSWIPTPCYLGLIHTAGTRYHENPFNCTNFNVWTDPT